MQSENPSLQAVMQLYELQISKTEKGDAAMKYMEEKGRNVYYNTTNYGMPVSIGYGFPNMLVILWVMWVLDSAAVWGYFAAMQKDTGKILVIAAVANGILFLINLFRTLFFGFPDSFLHNTAMIFSVNVVLHILLFAVFRTEFFRQPETVNGFAFYCFQMYIYLKAASAMAILPSLIMGGMMKMIEWMFGK